MDPKQAPRQRASFKRRYLQGLLSLSRVPPLMPPDLDVDAALEELSALHAVVERQRSQINGLLAELRAAQRRLAQVAADGTPIMGTSHDRGPAPRSEVGAGDGEPSAAHPGILWGESIAGSDADSGGLERELDHWTDPDLLIRALTHRSFASENVGLPTNERLEFLGDSVLGLVVTDTLYKRYPDVTEGALAKMRSAVVNSRALADVARGLNLGRFIRLGRSEEVAGGRDKTSILADALEAVLGAVYIDQGLDAAYELVHLLFDPAIEAIVAGQ